MNSEIKERLTALAFKRSKPFCYSCYRIAPTGTCSRCHSDDLMRHLDGVGVEYGTEWVIEHILKQELAGVDITDSFEDMIRDCYGETTKVGWIDADTVDLLKHQYPCDYEMAKSEYLDSLADDDQVVSFDNGSTYYWVHEIESLLDEELEEVAV
jgi:hypothetical protein